MEELIVQILAVVFVAAMLNNLTTIVAEMLNRNAGWN